MRDPLPEALRWLSQAQTDLDAGRLLSERFSALACFHAQQAAEKALKAILYAAGERVVLGHSVAELGQRVEAVSPGFAGIRHEVGKLDRYYVPTRYPNGLPEGGEPALAFDHEDARGAIEVASRAVEHARAHLEAGSG